MGDCESAGRAWGSVGAWSGDGFDGEDGSEELGGVVFFRGVLEDCRFVFGEGSRECGFGCSVAAEGDTVFEKSGGDCRENGG